MSRWIIILLIALVLICLSVVLVPLPPRKPKVSPAEVVKQLCTTAPASLACVEARRKANAQAWKEWH